VGISKTIEINLLLSCILNKSNRISGFGLNTPLATIYKDFRTIRYTVIYYQIPQRIKGRKEEERNHTVQ